MYHIEETISIDIGTSNICICYYYQNAIQLLQIDPGKSVFPSVIAFTKEGTVFGEAAKKSKNKVFQMKRILGRMFDDPVVSECARIWPFALVRDSKGIPAARLKLGEEDILITPIDFYVQFMNFIVQEVQKITHCAVKNVVLTVPANFGEHQRRAMISAANAVKLEVIALLNEPTAACIAYASSENLRGQKILVYDMGGGTFDVSIMEVTRDHVYKTLASNGNSHLGGMDFTECLYNHIVQAIRQSMPDIVLDHRKEAILREEVEQVKIKLSYSLEASVDLSEIDSTIEEEIIVSEDVFNKLTSHLINKSKVIVEETYQMAGLVSSDIDKVIMIGGGSRMECTRSAMNDIFEGKIITSIQPEEAVARGAMLYAINRSSTPAVSILGRSSILTIDQSSEIVNEEKSFPRSKLDETRITPVMKIEDINSLRYVVRVREDEVDELIPCNSHLSRTYIKEYQNYSDYVTTLSIDIAQGSFERFSENDFFARLVLTDLPARPRGEVRVRVEASINSFSQVSFKAWYNDQPAVLTDMKNLVDSRIMQVADEQALREKALNIERAQLRQKCLNRLNDLDRFLQVHPDEPWRQYYQELLRLAKTGDVTTEGLQQMLGYINDYLQNDNSI